MWSVWLSIRLTFNSDSMPPSSRGQLQHRSYIELSIHFCVLLKHLSSDAVTKYDRLGGLKNSHIAFLIRKQITLLFMTCFLKYFLKGLLLVSEGQTIC